jgi:hypothetical protein
MLARTVALLIALAVGVGGVIPHWTAYRCVMMTAAVKAEACCDRDDSAERTIGTACCDAFEAPAAVVRVAPKTVEPQIAPAPFVGLVPAPPLVVASSLSARAVDEAPPPTRSILALGAVLRI